VPGGPGSRRHPALRVIEMLWTDFGYPDEIRNLIGFVPAEPGELIGTEAIECRWRDYVERVRARIPEAGSSRVIADLDEIGDPSGWLHQGGTGGGLRKEYRSRVTPGGAVRMRSCIVSTWRGWPMTAMVCAGPSHHRE